MARRVLKVLFACLLWSAYAAVGGDIHVPTVLMLFATTVVISLVNDAVPVRGEG